MNPSKPVIGLLTRRGNSPGPVVDIRSEPGADQQHQGKEPPQSLAAAEPAVRRRWRSADLERLGVVYALLICVLFFSLVRPNTFPTFLNFRTILISEAILAIVSIGLMIPAAGGHFDLSIGYNVGFIGMEVAWLSTTTAMNPYLALVVGIATGACVGGLNGFVVVKLKMSSFIATLGSGIVLSGLTLGVSGGRVVFNVPKSIIVLGQGKLFTLEWPVFIALILIVALAFTMRRQRFGRYLYAVGGDVEAARLAGISVGRMVILSLMLSGIFGAIGGILFMANAGVADPASGADLLLPAFAAVFLGSTVIEPGKFNVAGTIVSLFFLAVLVNGLQQMGAPTWLAPVFNGVALIIAVAISVRKRGAT